VAEAGGGFVLRVPLADADLQRLAVGQPVSVTVAALGAEALGGRIVEIGARSDGATGTFEAEVALPFVPGLRSGLIGEARLISGTAGASTVAVPPLALFSARAGEGFVYVVDRGRARARLVGVGPVRDDRVEILRGLAPGEPVIVTGIERLRDGMPVRLTSR
jgi:RND family efflux transporter MFP subunit